MHDRYSDSPRNNYLIQKRGKPGGLVYVCLKLCVSELMRFHWFAGEAVGVHGEILTNEREKFKLQIKFQNLELSLNVLFVSLNGENKSQKNNCY